MSEPLILRDPLMRALTRWQERARDRRRLNREMAIMVSRLLRGHHEPHGGNVFRCEQGACAEALALIGRSYGLEDVHGRLEASIAIQGGKP